MDLEGGDGREHGSFGIVAWLMIFGVALLVSVVVTLLRALA